MFTKLILYHIPRTWQAATAMIVMLVATSIGLGGLTQVVVGSGHFMDWLNLVGGLVIGTVATIIYYRELGRAQITKSLGQSEVEVLAEAGKRPENDYSNVQATAYNLNDSPAEPPQGPENPSQNK